jgi:hypothetical protein
MLKVKKDVSEWERKLFEACTFNWNRDLETLEGSRVFISSTIEELRRTLNLLPDEKLVEYCKEHDIDTYEGILELTQEILLGCFEMREENE